MQDEKNEKTVDLTRASGRERDLRKLFPQLPEKGVKNEPPQLPPKFFTTTKLQIQIRYNIIFKARNTVIKFQFYLFNRYFCDIFEK